MGMTKMTQEEIEREEHQARVYQQHQAVRFGKVRQRAISLGNHLIRASRRKIMKLVVCCFMVNFCT